MSNAADNVRICHLITDLQLGGAEQALVRFLEHSDRDRFTPSVACLFGGDGPLADRIRNIGLAVTDLGMTQKWRMDALWRLRSWLRCERPEILHAWMFHANMAARIVGPTAGVPRIVTSRRNEFLGSASREAWNRWTARFSHRIITVCEAARRAELECARNSADRVITIPNGVDISHFPEPGQPSADDTRAKIRAEYAIGIDEIVLGTVARLRPQKGLQDLIQAVEVLRQEPFFDKLKLLIVGDGPERSRLEEAARQRRLDDCVRFAGLLEQPQPFLAAMDIFVSSSHWEGMPNAVLEAMAMGLPVVATDVGGTNEVVAEGETGLLVPPKESRSLAAAITALATNPERRVQYGREGRRRVAERFSLEQTVKKTEAVYESLLASGKGGP